MEERRLLHERHAADFHHHPVARVQQIEDAAEHIRLVLLPGIVADETPRGIKRHDRDHDPQRDATYARVTGIAPGRAAFPGAPCSDDRAHGIAPASSSSRARMSIPTDRDSVGRTKSVRSVAEMSPPITTT